MKVVSLFDKTGIAVLPWAEAGHTCTCYDIELYEGRVIHPNITYIQTDVLTLTYIDADFVCAFPPCTDLAVSGARWFKRKELNNPMYRVEAMSLVYHARDLATSAGCPYFIENPVSVISTEWRKPDYTFHPYNFTYYNEGDNYSKKTCLWTSEDFIMPEFNEKHTHIDYTYIHYMGKTRGNVGSMTPLGFAIAVYKANK